MRNSVLGWIAVLSVATSAAAQLAPLSPCTQSAPMIADEVLSSCDRCSHVRAFRRCARGVVHGAVDEGRLAKPCGRSLLRTLTRVVRSTQGDCQGGCFDTIGFACLDIPCRSRTDCPAFNVICSSRCNGGASESLRWYPTCGDPVCAIGGHRDHPGVAACGSMEIAGVPCSPRGARCDPGSDCNELLGCSTTPLRTSCPISRRAYKENVDYLTDADVERLRGELLRYRLATWTYKGVPSDRRHLGFMIDDVEPSPAVDSGGDQVDLYAYTSMAVATLQAQAKQIAALEREVAALKARAARSPARTAQDGARSRSRHRPGGS